MAAAPKFAKTHEWIRLDDDGLATVGISAYAALSVIMAMIFLKEKVSPGQWVGLIMIVGAVATMSMSQG